MNINQTIKQYTLFLTNRVKVCVLLLSVFSLGAVDAGTVTTENDSGAGSLRQIVSDASAGDTIDFDSGVSTITLATPIALNKNLTIDGSNVTISGGNTSQIFTVVSSTVGLNGLTLTNGNFANGGAIYCQYSTLNAADCTFAGNSALAAGAIYSESSTLSLNNCIFSGNNAGTSGAIFNYDSNLTANNCTFIANSGYSANGGAVRNDYSTFVATNCTFNNNSAGASAGAIQNFSSTTTATNCTFSGNSATVYGGAIFTFINSTLTTTNCTFSGNSATSSGGAVYIAAGNPFNLNNTIVAGNSAPLGPDCFGTITSNGYNFIGDTASITGVELSDKTFANTSTTLSDLLETAGPAPLLKNNGGVTDTIALVEGSPAINSGNNAAVVGIDYDQRGVGFPRIANGVVDIGAYESSIKTPIEKTNDLIAAVLNLGLSKGTQQSLLSKLFDVQMALNQEPIDLQTACDELNAFTNHVSAQSGKKIDPVDAAMLIAQANEIKTDLNCPLNTLECA